MTAVSTPLLAWYDENARVFPWRAGPGADRPDPYRVWLSEIMLQQTTTTAVIPYYAHFLARWPTVENFAAAADDEVMAAWAGLGYYARARNMLKCARAVADAGGVFPDTAAGLIALPGIGPYAGAAIAAICYGEHVAVVDGNVKRVFSRVFGHEDPASDADLRALVFKETPADRPGDFAQALMDVGATICKPRNPRCEICPLTDICVARMSGDPERFPKKVKKAKTPTRRGRIWIAQSEEKVFTVIRPSKGLLGGTMAFPSDGWDGTDETVPHAGEWQLVGEIKHVFTHFTAEIEVFRADLGRGRQGPGWHVHTEDGTEFPTLMKKAFLLGDAPGQDDDGTQ